jgi:hypothetical protein
VTDVDGQSVAGLAPFKTWSNAMPGDNFDYWVAFRNAGDTPFTFRGIPTGFWSNLPRNGTGQCTGSPDNSLVTVSGVILYAPDDSPSGCSATQSFPCDILKKSMENEGWHYKEVPNGSTPYSIGQYGDSFPGDRLEKDEFQIYKISLHLNQEADSCYQNATYNYSLQGEAVQDGGGF